MLKALGDCKSGDPVEAMLSARSSAPTLRRWSCSRARGGTAYRSGGRARNQIPYDFFVSKTTWGLSLFLETGEFRQENFNQYPRRSVAADELRRNRPLEQWKKEVRFEHCMPLRAIWRSLLDRGPDLDLATLLAIVGAYPPIIVTREEDKVINTKGKSCGAPEDRYAGIALACALKSDRHIANAARIMRGP